MTLTFIALLDFIRTFAFAISGARVAVRHRLDLFGVLVLSFTAATAGGIVRDVLIGTTPPVALLDWRYLGVSMLAGALVVVAGHAWLLPAAPVAVAGAALCFSLRLLAIRRGWRLPTAGGGEG